MTADAPTARGSMAPVAEIVDEAIDFPETVFNDGSDESAEEDA